MFKKCNAKALLLSLLCVINPLLAKTDPYQEVAIVTNTINWPYNQTTYGNDSFTPGTAETGNADSLLFQLLDHKGKLIFPSDFHFGVAHAAYQYEGNRVKPSADNPDGIGWSIWDVFSEKGSWLNPQSQNIQEVLPTSLYTIPSGEQAIEGYKPELLQEDIALAKQLGVKTFRLSISWPRLFPHPGMQEPDPEGVRYYQHVLGDLKAQGFEVLITLYHWDLPAWLYNYGDGTIKPEERTYGWLDYHEAKDNLTIKEFKKFAAICFSLFGQYTPYFATFNEPLTFTNSAIYQPNHAPGKEGFDLLRKLNPAIYGIDSEDSDKRLNYLMAANIIKAHYIAYKTFEQYRQQITSIHHKEARLGIVLNSDWAEPYRIIKTASGQLAYHPDDIKASKRNMDFMLGWWLEPVLFGHWPKSMQDQVGDRLPQLSADQSCLQEDGQPIACNTLAKTTALRLSSYIQSGGAADYITLNHYTGYFAADLDFAKNHFAQNPQENSIPPDQYGTNPNQLMAGWASDQQVFTTQFRYQKYGTEGDFPMDSPNRVFVIGKAGAKPWLRQTYFVFTKLLLYIDKYYLIENRFTKQHRPLSELEIFLTENGTSLYGESQKKLTEQLHDRERIDYIKGNLIAVWKAMQFGVKVKLYTYWSIFDNFEWAEGYDSRFGLIWIDYQNQFKRLLKDSFSYYQRIIKDHSVLP